MQKRLACNKATQSKIKKMVNKAIAEGNKPSAQGIATILNVHELAVANFVEFYSKSAVEQRKELAKRAAVVKAGEVAKQKAEAKMAAKIEAEAKAEAEAEAAAAAAAKAKS